MINDELSIGLSLNGVIHSRDGEYANNYQDEFGTSNDYDNSRINSQISTQGI